MNQSDLLEMFELDAEKGILYWKNSKKPYNNGKVAGCTQKKIPGRTNYVTVFVNGKVVQIHRVIWIMVYGSIPEGIWIDHINGISTDNRICNLRLASATENSCNSKIRSNNQSGVKGVGVPLKSGKRVAQLWYENKHYYLGRFESIDEARVVVEKKRNELHGDFARHK